MILKLEIGNGVRLFDIQQSPAIESRLSTTAPCGKVGRTFQKSGTNALFSLKSIFENDGC